MKQPATNIAEERDMTELTIGPDGRIFVFGLSGQMLEVLRAIVPADPTVQRLTRHLQQTQTTERSEKR